MHDVEVQAVGLGAQNEHCSRLGPRKNTQGSDVLHGSVTRPQPAATLFA